MVKISIFLSLLVATLIFFLVRPFPSLPRQQRLPVASLDVDRIQFRSSSGETVNLRRQYQGAPWSQQPQLSFFLDPQRLQLLAHTLLTLQGSEQDSSPLGEYQATTRANFYRKNELQLSIAFYHQGKTVLAIIPQKDRAYLISTARFPAAIWSLRQLTTRHLPIPELDLDGGVQRISIQTAEQSMDIRGDPEGRYVFAEPYDNHAVSRPALSRLLSPLTQLIPILAIQYHPPKDHKVMNNPTRISFFVHSSRTELVLGEQTRRGVYARVTPHPEILLLPLSFAPIKSASPFSLMNKKIYTMPSTKLSLVRYRHQQNSYLLTLEQKDDGTFQGELNGTMLGTERSVKYLGYLSNLFYEEHLNGRFFLAGPPQGQLIYRFSGGNQVQINFYAYPDTRYYAVSVDGRRPYFLIGRYQLLRLEAISQVFAH